jgi:hypothetical protein
MNVRKGSMLEYCKLILGKFSFSPRLFKKEYRKCFKYIEPEDHHEFRTWVREEFTSKLARKEVNALRKCVLEIK